MVLQQVRLPQIHTSYYLICFPSKSDVVMLGPIPDGRRRRGSTRQVRPVAVPRRQHRHPPLVLLLEQAGVAAEGELSLPRRQDLQEHRPTPPLLSTAPQVCVDLSYRVAGRFHLIFISSFTVSPRLSSPLPFSSSAMPPFLPAPIFSSSPSSSPAAAAAAAALLSPPPNLQPTAAGPPISSSSKFEPRFEPKFEPNLSVKPENQSAV